MKTLTNYVQNAQTLTQTLKQVTRDGIAQDIAENGIETIMGRELRNHEAYYTGDIADTYETLKHYGITYDQLLEYFTNSIKNELHG
jgi:hypothetical protein